MKTQGGGDFKFWVQGTSRFGLWYEISWPSISGVPKFDPYPHVFTSKCTSFLHMAHVPFNQFRLKVSTSATLFIYLHQWISESKNGYSTRSSNMAMEDPSKKTAINLHLWGMLNCYVRLPEDKRTSSLTLW